MGIVQSGGWVKKHEAWGLGIYSVFRHPDVALTRAIEVPLTPGVRFHHMITVALDDKGEISNVIDDKGGPTWLAPHRVTPKVTEFPYAAGVCLPYVLRSIMGEWRGRHHDERICF